MNKILTMAITVAAAAAAGLAADTDCPDAGILNTGVWFNGGDQQVNTGADGMYQYEVCEKTTMGYWYDYDDRNNQGGSSVWYPYDTTGYYGSYVAPMVAELGYLLIGYDLKDPTLTGQEAEYNYNFIGFGFNVKDGDQTPFDISGTEGLCVTYMSDDAVSLEVMEKESGDDACAVSLKKASTPTTIDFAIADFAQPKWATNKIECSAAFKAAQAIKFKVDGGAADLAGVLRVFSIGPKGTCTPGTLADEPAEFCFQSDGKGHAAEQSTCFANTSKSSTPKSIKANASKAGMKIALSGRSLSFSGISNATYEVVSLQGQVVKSGAVSSSVSLAKLQAGVYMVRVSGKSVNMTQKILVK